ncbi:MAG: aminomethyl transferase family protein [Gemmatimonadetes bacterium]|nr:aminomethyl transferase family protein [Gemmatimonadota bacterium]
MLLPLPDRGRLKTTPFHSRTAPLSQGQAWRRWAGYTVASSYDLTHDHEYAAIRSSAALIDVTPLYKYLITGLDSARLLDRVVTRDVTRCAVNQVMYTPWCDAEGKVLDDGTICRLEERRFRMTSAHPGIRWLERNATRLEVTIEDDSERTAALSLQGPSSREILKRVVDADMEGLKFFRATAARLAGIPATITRTGYTGDLGYEIWVDNGQAEALWDLLIEAGTPHGLLPTGLLAMDIARIEAGLLLIDVDYISARQAMIEAQKSSPFELGLGWTVSAKKGPFVGRRVLDAERVDGPEWKLCGLEVDWDSLGRLYAEVGLPPALPTVAWRTSVPVHAGGRQVGYATSGCWSPLLKKTIALAHLEASHSAPGTPVEIEITVEHRRRLATAAVVETPFFEPVRKRA